ncbi:MAG: hypothetical protein ABJA64_02325 [Candidatus Saccharibacteria bacterium]
MAETISVVALVIFFIFLFASDGIAKILSARKSKDVDIEKERTAQKRLDLEIAKVNAGLVSSSEG